MDYAGLTKQKSASGVDQQGTDMWIAWLAGIIDGEGSIGLYSIPKRSIAVRVTITNTGVKMLDQIVTILENHHLAYFVRDNQLQRGHNWKPRWQLIFSGLGRTAKFLELVLPWLVDKKQEAELVLEFIAIRKELGRFTEYGTREMEIIEQVKALKHTRHLRDHV